MTEAPGPRVGSGRDAEVFDIGDGRVLRRFRDPSRHVGHPEREAAVMAHVRANGYPVPEVFSADGPDLVMERLDGITILDDLAAHPWRVDRHARTWADLHRRLADVPVEGLADAGLPSRFGPPTAILHLDLHPANVMLTADGPVVFDWTNAALGPHAADVAQSWIIAASGSVEGGRWLQALARLLRRRLVDRYVDRAGRRAAQEQLAAAAAYRLADRNVRPEEAERIRALVAAQAPASAP